MQKYRKVQNLMGGNFDVFDAFQPDSQNLTHQTVQKTMQHLQVYAVTIRQNIFHQILEESISVKISPSKFCAIR